jgi:hypothetical protein
MGAVAVSRFSAQVGVSERVPRREIERVEEDVRLFLEVHERLPRPQVSQLRNILVHLVAEDDRHELGDPDAIHPATGERVGSREEHALAEVESLFDLFGERRRLLADTITAPQVADLLGISRQAASGRADSGALLAVLDRGAYRFPTWQFDARGPDGVLAGLPDVLRALNPQPAFTKLVWLTHANTTLARLEPLELLRRGEQERALAAAHAAAELP